MARNYNAKIQKNHYTQGDAVWVFFPNQNMGGKRRKKNSLYSGTDLI
jgi:hypothetical protein